VGLGGGIIFLDLLVGVLESFLPKTNKICCEYFSIAVK